MPITPISQQSIRALNGPPITSPMFDPEPDSNGIVRPWANQLSVPWQRWTNDTTGTINSLRSELISSILSISLNASNFVNVMDYGAVGDGITDDSPAVNLAATYIRSLTYWIPGAQQQSNPGVLYFPAGHTFRLETSINMQLIDAWGWGIYAKGAIILGATNGYPVFDCMGSAYGEFDDVYIVGDAVRKPWTGIAHGRLTFDAQQAGSHLFKNCKIDGHFTNFDMFGTGEGNCWLNPICHGTEPNTYKFAIDGLHHFVIPTLYRPCDWPQDTADSCIQHEIINCDFNGSAIGVPIFFSNINQLRISGYAVTIDSPGIVYLEGAGLDTIRNLEIDLHMEITPTVNIRFDSIASTALAVEGLNLRDHASGATVAMIQQGTNVTSLGIVSGDLFKGSGVSVPFTDGNVGLSANVRLNYGYAKFTPFTFFDLADDTAGSFLMPGNLPSAVLVITSSGAGTESAMIWARANGSPATQDVGSARGSAVNITTGVLAGTTGTDGKVTVSAASDGKIYIENRLGGSRTFSFLPVGY